MSIWEKYSIEQRKQYIQFLQVYGALTNLFLQKKGSSIPYLDSKFQETVYSKIFNGENVDIGNTPHDVLSIFGNDRIGIGIKTWMNSKPSFQKVMQIKRYQKEIELHRRDKEALATKISEIKNEKMRSDYERLGLSEDKNIYHFITRDEGRFTVNECAYPLIDIKNLKDFKLTETSLSWSDGRKDYKYTFSDSQIFQKFDNKSKDTFLLNQFDIKIIEDPFDFLLKAYLDLVDVTKEEISDIVEIYLPLYSYRSKEVKEKSGLNAWNSVPKNKNSNSPRPLNEIYIPIPIELHNKHPNFFVKDIKKIIEVRKSKSNSEKPEVRFNLELPNGKIIPALLTGDNLKNFQSGSSIQRDQNGALYGQNALGQWLLVDVLGLKSREKVTREWLKKKDTDSIRLWRNKNDYDSTIYIDFAPFGAFEAFMKDEPIPNIDE